MRKRIAAVCLVVLSFSAGDLMAAHHKHHGRRAVTTRYHRAHPKRNTALRVGVPAAGGAVVGGLLGGGKGAAVGAAAGAGGGYLYDRHEKRQGR